MRLIALAIALAIVATPAAAAQVNVRVDARTVTHTINPFIYGVNFGTRAGLKALNTPFNRMGGNTTSTYNWQQNAWNLGLDWYFESYPLTGTRPGHEADKFVTDTRAMGSEPMLTLPMLGYVAKLGPNRALLPSFSVAKYGPQSDTDYWYPDAGNGVRPNGTKITGNNPLDAYLPSDASTQRAWIDHLIGKFDKGIRGGVRYYGTDNEASIAWETHRDIRPVGIRAAEFRDSIIAYSAMVKGRDGSARIVGPEEWGYLGFLQSGYDQQTRSGADRAIMKRDYYPWLLLELKKAGKPLDVVSIHFYPQSGEFSDDVSRSMQLMRNRSTRELWDPDYTSASWMADLGEPVRLIPRLRQAVDRYYYPDTPIAITEYNWGAENHINGATTQADILGIFGRENVGMATRWTMPSVDSPVGKAMQMYRNYDGKNAAFGDGSVRVTVSNPDDFVAYAAKRNADKQLTLMLINKNLDEAADVRLSLIGVPESGGANAWQLTASNSITRLSKMSYSGSRLVMTVPKQSITLVALPFR